MIRTFCNKTPVLAQDVFVAENAVVIGAVKIESGASVWYGAVLRGDENSIQIGKNSNVQDNATVHTDRAFSVEIGEGVTIGHNAVVHGCRIENNVLIGMGAVVLNGCVIEEDSIIAAGALVKENTVIPRGSLVVGVPGKIVKALSPEMIEAIRRNAEEYARLGLDYAK